MIWRASSVAGAPGATPDLESSPEVLICMWMYNGEVISGWDWRSRARPASSWVAFLAVSTEETQKRLGMWEVSGLHLSRNYQHVCPDE